MYRLDLATYRPMAVVTQQWLDANSMPFSVIVAQYSSVDNVTSQFSVLLLLSLSSIIASRLDAGGLTVISCR